MIKKAKVSASAVKMFENAVSNTRDYSNDFNRGHACLEELLRYLAEQVTTLSKTIENLETVRVGLKELIKKIEGIIADLIVRISECEAELADLEFRLSCTSSTITLTNDKGESYSIPNPEYAYLKSQIRQVKLEISELKQQLYREKQRLERANNVEHKISAHIDSIKGVIHSLNEKQNVCKQLITHLEEIQRKNRSNGISATETLRKIEKLIDDYLHVRMVYEAGKEGKSIAPQEKRNINITININNNSKEVQGEEQQETYREYKDDNGNLYRKDNELIPNNVYVVNGYKYKTDSKARIVSAGGKLQVRNHEGRYIMDDKSVINKGDMRQSDDRGHLIADRFNGSGGLENVVAMDAELNQHGDYQKMERTLAQALEDNKEVYLYVEPTYKNESTRPSFFKVTTIVDGEKRIARYKNERRDK